MAIVQVGKPAPDFQCTAVVDGRLKEVNLASYTEANHWLILIFFPKAWSFICPTEIRAFSTRLEEFLYSRSCAVVFASTDSEHCLKAWNGTSELEGGLGGVHVPLLSDCSHKLSRDYGVLIEEQGVAQRALFIIDPKGQVRAVTVNDADIGRSVDEAQRVLDALAFRDAFGEGCPADWKKGDKGVDITHRNHSEGQPQVKKLWTEWARPKLQRAWSGTSQPSNTPVTSSFKVDSVLVGNGGPGSVYQGSVTNGGQQSPLLSNTSLTTPLSSPLASPTSVPMANGVAGSEADYVVQQQVQQQQRKGNIQASMQNQGIGVMN